MAGPLALIFTTFFTVAVFGDLDYYQQLNNPPDESFYEELKEIFKTGEFLPYDPKAFSNVQYEPEGEQLDGSPMGYQRLNSEEFDYDDGPTPLKQGSLKDEVRSPEGVATEEPEFYFNPNLSEEFAQLESPFAVPPIDPRYFTSTTPSFNKDKASLKRAVTTPKPQVSEEHYNNQYDEKLPQDLDSMVIDNLFEEPRQQRQNPNLAATKINKIVYTQENAPQESILPIRSQNNGKFKIDRDIPTSLVPTTSRHQHVIQQALKNSEYNKDTEAYVYAGIAGIGAAATVAITAFAIGWYSMRKKSKAAVDVEYPAYGVTGPNMDVTPSGDRQLAHSAQMYHYQHQKQQIIAMESRGGITERNGSVSDAESEDENDEGDYTVYECPGFATTGEMEVKNPLFLDEPTPATPAQQQPATTKPKEK